MFNNWQVEMAHALKNVDGLVHNGHSGDQVISRHIDTVVSFRWDAADTLTARPRAQTIRTLAFSTSTAPTGNRRFFDKLLHNTRLDWRNYVDYRGSARLRSRGQHHK